MWRKYTNNNTDTCLWSIYCNIDIYSFSSISNGEICLVRLLYLFPLLLFLQFNLINVLKAILTFVNSAVWSAVWFCIHEYLYSLHIYICQRVLGIKLKAIFDLIKRQWIHFIKFDLKCLLLSMWRKSLKIAKLMYYIFLLSTCANTY